MAMVALNFWVFGYRIITPEEGFLPRLASHLLSLGIPARGVVGGFAIRESDFPRFSAYAKGRIRYEASETLGLWGAIKRQKRDIPAFIAFLISLVVIILLTGLVWDVRIISDESVEEERIVNTLAELGFSEGTAWSGFDKEGTEALLLDRLEDVAWISINRDGVVAMVEVRMRAKTDATPPEPYEASNVVAAFDGVVEEIIVEEGTPLVKRGDVVRKGDILISGIIETEYGTVITAARGRVVAHRFEELTVDVERERTITELVASRVGAARVTILGSSINIFKNYGNLSAECAIIEEKVRATLPNGVRLPISLTFSYIAEPVSATETYTDSELPILAREALFDELNTLRGDGDLIKLSTSGEYTESGYRITLKAVIADNIAEEREIELN